MAKINPHGSQGLDFLNMIMQLFSGKPINIPGDFHSQALALEDLLMNDVSGLVNAILDFAIQSATVDFTVEAENKTVSTTLNDWLKNVNEELRGKVPVGIKPLAKQYYRERWKGSSLLLLRSIWERKDGFMLPTKLWFVNGKDIVIKDDENTKELGKETYELIRGKGKENLVLPAINARTKKELIFVQKPFESWATTYPTPFLIQRGTYYNLEFLRQLTDKGVNVVEKAIEYLALLKKGDPELIKLNRPDLIYSQDDLRNIQSELKNMLGENKTEGGTPLYATNFDTDFDHLIPDYTKVLNSGLYSPVERRILAGLGFIEVMEGITNTRKDAIINPQVFVSEVKQGVSDFSIILKDILVTILQMNKKRRKLINSGMIEIRTSPITQFMSEDAKLFLRSLYDRGLLSKRTTVEVGVETDFDAEVERRKKEQEEGLDDNEYKFILHPPIIQNVEGAIEDDNDNSEDTDTETEKEEDIDEDKTGPEARNFNASNKKTRKKRTYKKARKKDKGDLDG